MYFKDIAYLCKETVGFDKFHRPCKTGFSKREVFCDVKGVNFAEFYQAKAVGFKPSITLTVKGLDYQAEEYVEFDGRMYNVLRYYPVANECYELTCEAFTAGQEAEDGGSDEG